MADCPTAHELVARGCIVLCSEYIVRMSFEQVKSPSASCYKAGHGRDLKNVKITYKSKPWNWNGLFSLKTKNAHNIKMNTPTTEDSKLPECSAI